MLPLNQGAPMPATNPPQVLTIDATYDSTFKHVFAVPGETEGILTDLLNKLLLLEGGLLSLGGTILGLLISRIGLFTLASAVENKFQYDLGNLGLLTSEIYLALGATFVGLIAAALPAFKTLRLDISKTLSSE